MIHSQKNAGTKSTLSLVTLYILKLNEKVSK